MEEWSAADLDRIGGRDRILLLFEPARAAPVRRHLDALEPEACVPCARVSLPRADPRRARHLIRRLPTLAYFEHGEELERVEAPPGRGLTRADVEELLALVEGLQEEPMLPRRMHGPRRAGA